MAVPTTRQRGWKARLSAGLGSVALVAITAWFGGALSVLPADAQQWVGIQPRARTATPKGIAAGKRDPKTQMLVQAGEIQYDYTNERVSAVGNVQIGYGGATLEAARVTYDQRTRRLTAEGGVRLTETDGTVVTAEKLELGEEFRDGFIESLQVETSDKIRYAATRADRNANGVTVFQSGVYTACEPCLEDPTRPLKWQVRTARIIHDEGEKMIYFEDAVVELFGYPIAYFPYFSTPDPSVKKKSGLLGFNIVGTDRTGLGIQVPYFWNIAPDYDLTLSPIPLSRQGLLTATEWRQRLQNGSYWVRASGLYQLDKSAFGSSAADPGYRDFRGAIESKGDFRLSEKWFYGYDVSLFTDKQYAPDYRMTRQGAEAISQGYLFGRGAYSYFDARSLYFYGFSPIDVQKQLPILHPLLDYKYRYADPVFGGELSYNVNVTSMTREQADYDPISRAAFDNKGPLGGPAFSDGKNVCDSQDLRAIKTRQDCLLRGIGGTYTRLSGDALWRRSLTDSFGQIFTPFFWVRADIGAASINPDPYIGQFIKPGETGVARAMPALGLDYRYPFLAVHSWGTQTIEPRVQVIARPNESAIGRLPNEDSQSLLYDDANLFAISKFPGYDRVEGGGRVNAGIQYTAQFNRGGYVNALFGQSYQIFGTNSYAVADMANTGLQSGLEKNASDFVGRFTFAPNRNYSFISRYRLDEVNFQPHRLEFEGRATFDRWTASLTYGRYDAQETLGLLFPRAGLLGSTAVKLTQNWIVNVGALYNLDVGKLNTATFGLGYVDECIALNASYNLSYGYYGSITPSKSVMLRLTLRSLGGFGYSQSLDSTGIGTGAPAALAQSVSGVTPTF